MEHIINRNTSKAVFIFEHKKVEDGRYDLIFDIDDDFFSLFEYSEIRKSRLKANVTLEIIGNNISADILIRGRIGAICDICLDEFDLAIENQVNLFFKVSDKSSLDDEIIYISPSDDYIDFTKHLYDYAVLSLPIKKVHPKDIYGKSTCNPEMLEYLQQTSSGLSTLSSNPAWNDLKNLTNIKTYNNGTPKEKNIKNA